MMTREEKLTTMTMACLVEIAKGLGIKIDKKGAKAKAVAKIMEAEAKKADAEEVKEVMKQKKELGIECPKIESVEIVNAGNGTSLAEVGKEIAEQAKEKSKKASKKKAEQKSAKQSESAVASYNGGQILVSDVLAKNNVNYKIVGKRIRLLDVSNKCFAYILTNKSNIRVYICESSSSYSQIADVAVDNKCSKSRYNKIVTIEYSDAKAIVGLAVIKN